MALANDEFTAYHQSLIEGSYDCVDRLVIKAYYSQGQTPGGLRVWWRRLFGSDDNLDDTHLMRMAGRFGRRARGWAKANGIPVQFCAAGERKHDIAEEHAPKSADFTGVFLIQVSKAPALVWEAVRRGKAGLDLRRKDPWPYVNHYSFHIMDPEWGHITIRMSSHPPFGAMIILNGHEWVERQAARRGLQVTKQDNCFTGGPDLSSLDDIAETLNCRGSIGRLSQVCDRWIYSACLCFGLDLAEQERTLFHYSYSVYQIEESHNLIFKAGDELDQVYQGMIDRTRSHFDLSVLKTVFGWRHRPHRSIEKRRPVAKLEKPSYDVTVFKVRFDNLTLKIYDKGERVLRIEAVAHDAGRLRCGRVIEKLPDIVAALKAMLARFLSVLRCADHAFLDCGTLDSLPIPTQIGQRRLAGVDINKARMRAVLSAVMALAPMVSGFSIADLARKVREHTGWTDAQYASRHAAYDLSKLRGKSFVQKIPQTRRHIPTPFAVRTIAALLTITDRVIKPILEGVKDVRTGRPPKNVAPIDIHYKRLREEMRATLATLGIQAC